jgi:uncharacterized protein
MESAEGFHFSCDAMLGGLARWLRVAGYDAAWYPNVDDWELIRISRREKRILLSCDTGIFKTGIVRDGLVKSLFIPHGLSKQSQLEFVFKNLGLRILEPRCMACSGPLTEISKAWAQGRIPPRTYAWIEKYFECTHCKKLFWKGTHWLRISSVLTSAQLKDC